MCPPAAGSATLRLSRLLVRTLLIGLAVVAFVVALTVLDWLVKKTQEERMARQWDERERWRHPGSKPRRANGRRSRRRWRV